MDSGEPKEACSRWVQIAACEQKEICVRWGRTLASLGECHWNVHVRGRCGLLSNYFDHLLVISTTTVLRPFFWDHPGEPVTEENFWTLWCNGRLTEADTPTIRLGATPSGLTSAHLHHSPYFLQAGCPSCHPTNRIKALKAIGSW